MPCGSPGCARRASSRVINAVPTPTIAQSNPHARPPLHMQTHFLDTSSKSNPFPRPLRHTQIHFYNHQSTSKSTRAIRKPISGTNTQTHIHAYTNIYANGIYCTYQKSSQTMACYSYHIKIHQLCFHHNRKHARHSISKPARTPTTTKSYMQGHHYAPTPFTPPAR